MTVSERIAGIFNYLSMTAYLVILCAAITAFTCVFIWSETKRANAQACRKRLRDSVPDKTGPTCEHTARWLIPASVISIIAASAALLSVLCAAGLIDTYLTAREHGYRSGFSTNAEGLWNTIHNSPKEGRIPETDEGMLFVYYRFGCPDCEATYHDTETAFDGIANIIWISTRTETGAELLERYPVDSVPTAVYINKDGDPFTVQLTGTGAKSSILDPDAILDLTAIIRYDKENQ